MSVLSGGRELADLNRKNPRLGSLFARMIDGINHMAAQAGIDPVGQTAKPQAPNSVTGTVIGEQLHIRVNDNAASTRSHNYISEIHADADFTTPLHVIHHGISRDASVVLPTQDSTGATNSYYLRSYRQLPGSPPSDYVVNQTAIQMAGTTQGTVPASAGSGTSAANGTQSGQGYGIFATRKATGPKRSVL